MSRRLVLAILLLSMTAATIGTGWVVVAPGEEAVVRRFGRVLPRVLRPGLHWKAPFGVDRVTRIRTDEVRYLAVGLGQVPSASEAPGTGEFLTADLNLVRAEATIQYQISESVAFVLAGDDAISILKRLAEASLGRSLATRTIDETLLAGRVCGSRSGARNRPGRPTVSTGTANPRSEHDGRQTSLGGRRCLRRGTIRR